MDVQAQSRSAGTTGHGPQVASVRTRGGVVGLKATNDLRIRVHTGTPVTGTCHAERFRYEHGDMDMVVAGQADSWVEDGPAHSVIVRFSPMLLESTADDLGLAPGLSKLAPRHQLRDPQLAHIAWALDAERMAGSPSGRLYTESLGTAMAVHLLSRYSLPRALPAHRSAPGRLSAAQLARVTDYIDAHIGGDLSLSALVAVAFSSVSHFKVQFRRTLGLPVHAYVMRRRVETARDLIARRDVSLAQVAALAGFAHQSHMARHIRRMLGMTPGELRRASA